MPSMSKSPTLSHQLQYLFITITECFMRAFNFVVAVLLGCSSVIEGYDYVNEELCNRIPKVELHAHLHGSIRQSTLEEFSRDRDYVGVYINLTILALF
jgi:hypothetical protein